MRVGRGTARKLAWLALAGQVAFIATWIVVGALEAGYSYLEQGVSELGADDAENPVFVNAAIVVWGLSFAVLGPALLAVLPRRRARVVAAGLFLAAGLTVAVAGLLPLDCQINADERCEELWRDGRLSTEHEAHMWLGIPGELFIAATPFALARALWPSVAGAAALWGGTVGFLAGLILFFLPFSEEIAAGLTQRLGMGILHLWVVIVAGGVLYATRPERPQAHLVPLRPRDFFAREWVGEGEFVLRPFLLGRRFAARFPVRRRSTWISERVWRFDDEAGFGNGRFRRQMFCELVADDHVYVTAGDLPEGADVWIEDGGLRFAPFRSAFPIGPVPIHVRCYDRSYVEDDGTFVNVIDAHTLGLDVPFARVTFRVRPQSAEPPGEEAATDARPEPRTGPTPIRIG
jgi:hypothetical protein